MSLQWAARGTGAPLRGPCDVAGVESFDSGVRGEFDREGRYIRYGRDGEPLPNGLQVCVRCRVNGRLLGELCGSCIDDEYEEACERERGG